MKILVATGLTQGRRTNDFCWAEEGEIVTFGSECTNEFVDGPCGCRRALRGVRTRKATTTFRVVERSDLSPDDLARMVAESLVAGGWYPSLEQAHPAASEDALRVAAIAFEHAEGSILERRDECIVERRPGAATDDRAASEEHLREAGRIFLENARRILALPEVGHAVQAPGEGESRQPTLARG